MAFRPAGATRRRAHLWRALLLGLAIGGTVPSRAGVRCLVVDSPEDEPDAAPGDGSCATALGTCTLRAAIEEANTTPGVEGHDVITFAIPGPGPHTIRPASPLPTLTEPLVIDGYTQPGAVENTADAGSNAILLIELSGENAGDSDGLRVTTGDSIIRGLVVNRWSRAGLVVEGNNDGIWGNFIGTDPTGRLAAPNATGVIVSGPYNAIGWSGQRNVISGNAGPGVELLGVGNYVWSGVIGLDAPGVAALGNFVGVVARGPQSEVGSWANSNVISGNLGPGILVDSGATDTRVTANRIGTDAHGGPGFGNGGDGVLVTGAQQVVIGETSFDGNDIVTNGGRGIALIGAQNALVKYNRIGTTDGSDVAGNGGSGIWIEGGGSNYVGDLFGGNVLAFNAGDGISISGATSTENTLEGNAIYSNDGLGIDLGTDGHTGNDDLDTDAGPNGLQNHPIVRSATVTGNDIRVDGELRSAPSTAFRVEVFGSTACDPSGAGEGEWWFRIADVLTDSGGLATFTVTFTTSLPVGGITATARDATGNTSEFSPCVVPGPAPVTTTSTSTTVSSSTSVPSSTTTTTMPDPGGCVWESDMCRWLDCQVTALAVRIDGLRCGRERMTRRVLRLTDRVRHFCTTEDPALRRFRSLTRRIGRLGSVVDRLDDRCPP
jgi:CSLREA domain-containing protein